MVSVVAPAFMTTNPADLVTLIVVVFLAKILMGRWLLKAHPV